MNIFMGTGDQKMNAFKVVPLHFGITSKTLKHTSMYPRGEQTKPFPKSLFLLNLVDLKFR